VQATHRAEAELAELQRPSGRDLGWCEGYEQAHRAWHAFSPSSKLNSPYGLDNGYPAADVINEGRLSLCSHFQVNIVSIYGPLQIYP
jgi:hypothetical protein